MSGADAPGRSWDRLAACNSWLARRRARTFIFFAVALMLLADAGLEAAPEGPGDVTWITWFAIGAGVYATVTAVFLSRLIRGPFLPLFSWVVSCFPFLFGFAALMADSPTTVMWGGLALSLLLGTKTAPSGKDDLGHG
ncbi:MAG: hypothetical protein M3Q20_05645 [Actinomycetota bacterium]|nr:hypothetical protein [Actinomycetota bacterium]